MGFYRGQHKTIIKENGMYEKEKFRMKELLIISQHSKANFSKRSIYFYYYAYNWIFLGPKLKGCNDTPVLIRTNFDLSAVWLFINKITMALSRKIVFWVTMTWREKRAKDATQRQLLSSSSLQIASSEPFTEDVRCLSYLFGHLVFWEMWIENKK